jgi:hypothetical protein
VLVAAQDGLVLDHERDRGDQLIASLKGVEQQTP